MTDLFERASRADLSFPSPRGPVPMNQLWTLPLQSRVGAPNLDDIAKTLHKRLKSDDGVSFVDKEKASDPVAQMMFDVVKHVIDVRVAERDAAQEKEKLKQRDQRILALINDKQDEVLKGKSIEELTALLSPGTKAA